MLLLPAYISILLGVTLLATAHANAPATYVFVTVTDSWGSGRSWNPGFGVGEGGGVGGGGGTGQLMGVAVRLRVLVRVDPGADGVPTVLCMRACDWQSICRQHSTRGTEIVSGAEGVPTVQCMTACDWQSICRQHARHISCWEWQLG